MSNEVAVQQQDAALKAYRNVFVDRAKAALDMTLHELVDEFQRLTAVIEDNFRYDSERDRKVYNEAAQLALRERNIFASIANARFGIGLSTATLPSDDEF